MSVTQNTMISHCGTHHIDAQGAELYAERFDEVLPFYQVNNVFLAVVKKGEVGWHIDTAGNPVYSQIFQRCFGFYCGYAAVIAGDGWHHIKPDGNALYNERYSFVGNYQENAVVVCRSEHEYFHIDDKGLPLYKQYWAYCGDFCENIAVIQAGNGLSSHIYMDGTPVHNKWFINLDVYHKGFAKAKTDSGWCHIDKDGNAIYTARYAFIEPFYNGFARCEKHNGELIIIDELGNCARQLRAKAMMT